MNIVHICLCGPYTEGMTYQDNLLPIYQSRMGHSVTIITSEWMYNSKGQVVTSDEKEYVNEYGIRVIRIHSNSSNANRRFKRFKGLSKALRYAKPDALFVHGIQFLDLLTIDKYIAKKGIKAVADNHADFKNSAQSKLSKHILHGVIWKCVAKYSDKYICHYFGVLPSRVDFLIEQYGLPSEKVSYLPLGADDEEVERVKRGKAGIELRKQLELANDDFVIVTGGKITGNKPQILNLMRAIASFDNQNVYLIIFGSVDEKIRSDFDLLCECDRIKYLGWFNSHKSYECFEMADLICFPSGHSVFWEQCVALRKPIICNYWNGITHINFGGNVRFLHDCSVIEIKDILEEIICNPAVYKKMQDAACNEKADQFLYSRIASESVAYY